ncbi:MAG: M28 family peptidase [Lunatimonas sp.]|uniref:M28 family metallopeptidase n=1 Tax=Lunatimonas sp. TaxID=2060141 RepID=UPI00263B5814|nr:M28 family metallopeptidase [Lunatimonas sp.]MCC5938933.1 M28 family peptidase [Lunatimonas sp.]
MNNLQRLLRNAPLAILLITWFVSCQSVNTDQGSTVQLDNLEKHIQVLSSDDFMGRMPFTDGETKTVAYLTEQFTAMGLTPGNGGSFEQAVPLKSVTTQANPEMDVRAGQVSHVFEGLKDYVLWTQRTEASLQVEEAELVFAGFGIVAPEYGWNDYQNLDVEGKIVLVLVNDPGFGSDDPAFFKGNTMTYYGRWTYKYEEAARQGALGCLVIHNTIPAGYGFNVVQNSWNTTKLYLDAKDGSEPNLSVEGWVSYPMATKLFEMAGYNDRELLAKARSSEFTPIPLGLLASTDMEVAVAYNTSKNFVATIPGATRPEEYIVYTAHWDHLGIGKPDERGDSIYNGALDNASGTAALLEIARLFAESPEKPDRTVVFLAVTAEEQGLLGSAHYAQNPVFPLDKTVANINMDGINPYGRMRDMELVGMGQSELEDLAAEELEKEGRYVAQESNPGAGFYFRSDHFNFAKVGVPALYMGTGIDHVEKGKEYGKELADNYVAQYYHKPSDEYDPDRWNLEGAVEDVGIYYRVGRRLAFSDHWPAWKEGSEFKAIRKK